MQREFPEVPLVGVGAIIIEGSRVLLVKRAHPPLQAEWSIPGGVLEVGELIREAAVREAREETGLTVEPEDLLGVYDRVLRNPEQRVQYHYVLIDFLCRRIGGELQAASDAAEVRWCTLEELPALKLAEDPVDVIRKGFGKLGCWLGRAGDSVVFPLGVAGMAAPGPAIDWNRHVQPYGQVRDWPIEFLESDIQRLALWAMRLLIFTDARDVESLRNRLVQNFIGHLNILRSYLQLDPSH